MHWWSLGFVLWFIFFACVSAADQYKFEVDFSFPDGRGENVYHQMALDPARNSLQVISNERQIVMVHPDRRGMYSFAVDATQVPIKLHFRSKDLMFTSTEIFLLELDTAGIQMKAYHPGNTMQFTSALAEVTGDCQDRMFEITLEGPANGVELASWTAPMAPQTPLFQKLFSLQLIKDNKLATGLVIALIMLRLASRSEKTPEESLESQTEAKDSFVAMKQ